LKDKKTQFGVNSQISIEISIWRRNPRIRPSALFDLFRGVSQLSSTTKSILVACAWLLTQPSMLRAQDAEPSGHSAAADAAAAAAEDALAAFEGIDDDAFAISDEDLRKAILNHQEKSYAQTPPELRQWFLDLRKELERRNIGGASRAIASQYSLPAKPVRRLIESWGRVQAKSYTFFGTEPNAIRRRERLVHDLSAALEATASSPILLQFAAYTLHDANFCDASLSALPMPADDRAAALRMVGNVTGCPEPLFEAARADNTHRIADIALLDRIIGDPGALTLWLLRDEAVNRVAPEDRKLFILAMTRKAIVGALKLASLSRALALYDALGEADQRTLLWGMPEQIRVMIDGLPVTLDGRAAGEPQTSLAAALFSMGRKDEARAVIQADPNLPSIRALTECRYAARTSDQAEKAFKACADDGSDELETLNVDDLVLLWAIDEPDSDPYPLLENGFTDDFSSFDAPMAQIHCALFNEAVAGKLCANARRSVAYRLQDNSNEEEESQANKAAISSLDLDGIEDINAMLERERDAAIAAFKDSESTLRFADRPAIEPIVPSFQQHRLTADLVTDRSALAARADEEEEDADPAFPKDWAALPNGFRAVRWERDGQRAIVISVSNAFDRGGEVGRGGYWVHLSQDGGRSWAKPLYTGLAAFFPYVVMPDSKLPMLNGERLQIEVEYALLDTSSISYPPVGLRTLRRETDLWIDVPIEMLSRDSNDDGVTDLAAEHLLIDGPTETKPFLIGSDAGSCTDKSTDTITELRSHILRTLTGIDEMAVIEPIDRPAETPVSIGMPGLGADGSWPLFVKAKMADMACMAPLPMPVLIYDEKGEDALQRRSPDFRLLELPSLVMNREKTRGYAIWSAGWTGGTLLFWKKDGKWRFDTISSWIT
jgi:hypothetical protein